MADMRGEPTMEEILASIRRIIAEDPAPSARIPTVRKSGSRQPMPPADAAEPVSGSADDDDDELSPGAGDFKAHFQAASEDMAIPPLPDESEELTHATEAADVQPPEEEVLELTDIAEDPAILSAATASATAERLQHLSEMMTRPDAGSMTLDALVREMLRPMLKDWLDANLPDIVDQVVSREIARLTGKGR